MNDGLVEAVEALEDRVRLAVAHRRAVDPEPGDGFLGLHLSDGRVDALFEREHGAAPLDAAWVPPGAPDGRLTRLARAAGLDSVDIALLVVAAAPDVDRRFEWFYGYLHDDVTRKRASVGLALELADQLPFDGPVRGRLGPSGALVRHGLVAVTEADRPNLTRQLVVPDRVIDHLLGGDGPSAALTSLVNLDSSRVPAPAVSLPSGASAPLVYLRAEGGSGLPEAAASVISGGRRPMVCDLRALPAICDWDKIVAALHLEALLEDQTIVIGPVDVLPAGASMRQLASGKHPVVATGARSWDPLWSEHTALTIDLDVARPGGSAEGWARTLPQLDPAIAPVVEVAAFRLDAERTVRAAEAAALAAEAEGVAVHPDHLRQGARAQNTARLESLAHRIEPAATWDQLVLPADQLDQLYGIAARARLRQVVLEDWGLRRGGSRGEGIAVLFSGESGTGKTMSAEVLASELGQDLYRVDLSTVVDKYIGETEKNLERIFTEAEHSNGVLFFDEADALFGKRSEVSDAHDRHANVEVAYLLQRMEDFSGIAILATNLRANLDEAFTRRLTAMIDFAMPDERARYRLWDGCLGPKVPRGDDLDLAFCARQFELSGGSIRNIALAAAFLAADGSGRVGMSEVMAATRQEYRKMGRLVTEREFATWA